MLTRDRKKLQRITENVIRESTTEQLTEIYCGLVKVISLRSVEEAGSEEPLNEMISEVEAEINSRQGGSRDLQQPPAA